MGKKGRSNTTKSIVAAFSLITLVFFLAYWLMLGMVCIGGQLLHRLVPESALAGLAQRACDYLMAE